MIYFLTVDAKRVEKLINEMSNVGIKKKILLWKTELLGQQTVKYSNIRKCVKC